MLVSGNGFLPGATVQLTRSGQPAIVGNPVQADVGGSALSATFDLTGRPPGVWDVVVVNPDSTSKTLPAGFTIEAGGAPDLWVDVIGLIRREGPSTLTIIYGNRGKVDALAVPLQISVSGQFGLTVLFSIAQPPSQPDQRLTDFSQVPVTVQADAQNSYTNLPLLLPVVPAGFTGDNLPVTVSFLGPAFSEPKLLALGYSFEQATHARRLPVHTPNLPKDTITP